MVANRNVCVIHGDTHATRRADDGWKISGQFFSWGGQKKSPDFSHNFFTITRALQILRRISCVAYDVLLSTVRLSQFGSFFRSPLCCTTGASLARGLAPPWLLAVVPAAPCASEWRRTTAIWTRTRTSRCMQ